MPDQQIPNPPDHSRPTRARDEEVAAAGKLSEALETVERARGRLYDFHQLIGHADLMLDEAVQKLRESGRDDMAEQVEKELIGRNVLNGRWTFQIVEDFDDHYWSAFRECEAIVRSELCDERRHVFESEMKESRRTHGHPRHDARP
ncbi:conserved hypothetical protein [Rhodococcus jostii RHA1]|uniref:Uncharacterized protein n=1 Tax=Rhodococcus jostii (strain RHA1) TaxID=101510 RepID=Q0SB77_RHOJR|nr:hypothetical protein [Rhodococcus jostii]ABG95209.1 conserved hypothetical protein [Rhodococcus jostii RHA1]